MFFENGINIPMKILQDHKNNSLACELVSRPRGTTKGQGKGAGKDEELEISFKSNID